MTRTVQRRGGVDLTNEATAASERVAAKLAKKGLVSPSRPVTEMPSMPADITELDDESLLGLMTEMVTWADYAATQLAFAAIDEKATTNLLEFGNAEAMVRGWGDDTEKVTIARARRNLDADVIGLKQQGLDAYATRKLLETLFNNLERDASLLSRELTRRTAGSAPTTRRASRWNA